MQKYFMLIRNDLIYIKSNISSKVVEYSLNNKMIYPNVPLYSAIFNDEKIIKDIRVFIRNNLDNTNTFMQKISGKKLFLLIPDDVTVVTDIERYAFYEFGKTIFGVKDVIIGGECSFVAPLEENNYICISKTCRMMIITYIKDRKPVKQKFIKNRDYTNEEIHIFISELYVGTGSIPKVYLNGVGLLKYSDIGIVIDSVELINTFGNIVEPLKIK
ncbi:hypothetical protein [Clostridium sp.]|uniref:hypothetical protein n=1 Tax=Clostridium sp. TaxID=1506 RepID=UPI002610FDD3|nr:hypothetical protein [uncultured Clostridium sp.]